MATFEGAHAAVVKELRDHPEVWLGHVGPSAEERIREWNARADRIRALSTEGVQPMVLIHNETLKQLKRIPSYEEAIEKGYAKELSEIMRAWKPTARAPKGPQICFMSHRWDAMGKPDVTNEKAIRASKHGDYVAACYKYDVWWWIDFACVDQNDVGPHIASLPLYVAASEEVMSFYKADSGYDRRGWIRCERALAAALNSPRAWKLFPSDFKSDKGSEFWLLDDPADGECSMPGDRKYLVALGQLAKDVWPAAFERNWNARGEGANDYSTTQGSAAWRTAPTLVYGKQRIMTWHMNSHHGS